MKEATKQRSDETTKGRPIGLLSRVGSWTCSTLEAATRGRKSATYSPALSLSRFVAPSLLFIPSLALAADSSNAAGLTRVLFLEDYNTRIVMLGTVLLGIAAGLIGIFMLLRRRALMGDALSHATLPGITLAFMLATVIGLDGKSLPLLLAGAAVTGLIGVLLVLGLRHTTRIKEDSAMGVVLSVFFGIGIALLGVAQRMEQGHSAGLESFIYGKTASMIASDAALIALVATISIALSVILYKELRLLCFDQSYATTQGYPVIWLDVLLMSVVTIVTVIGLQAVGLVLVIALLVIPAAAARFWTHRLWKLLLVSAGAGGLSCYFGTALSAMAPDLPSGAMIVLTAAMVFVLSMCFGPAGGLIHRYRAHRHLQRITRRQNVLRAMFELIEPTVGAAGAPPTIPTSSFDVLLVKRSWTPRQLQRQLHLCQREGLVSCLPRSEFRLTLQGLQQARHVTRQHRLWELFLITHADIAPSHVDRSADLIEHVLSEELVAELETLLERQQNKTPQSPHQIAQKGAGHGSNA